jgi:hypothetical protein
MLSIEKIIEERNKEKNTQITKREEALANFYSNSEKYQEQVIEWINKHINKQKGRSDIVKNGYAVLQLSNYNSDGIEYILAKENVLNNFTKLEFYQLLFSQQKIKYEFEKNGFYFEIKELELVYRCIPNIFLIISTKKTRNSWWYYFDSHNVWKCDILNKLH